MLRTPPSRRRLTKLLRAHRGVCRTLRWWVRTPYGGRKNRRRTLQAIVDLDVPTLAELTRVTGLAYRTVRRHLDDLERLGVITTSTYPRTARPASVGWDALIRAVLAAVDGAHLTAAAGSRALWSDILSVVSDSPGVSSGVPCSGGSGPAAGDPLAVDDGKDPPTPPPEWFERP